MDHFKKTFFGFEIPFILLQNTEVQKVGWSGMSPSNVTIVWHPRQQLGEENAAHSSEKQVLVKSS